MEHDNHDRRAGHNPPTANISAESLAPDGNPPPPDHSGYSGLNVDRGAAEAIEPVASTATFVEHSEADLRRLQAAPVRLASAIQATDQAAELRQRVLAAIEALPGGVDGHVDVVARQQVVTVAGAVGSWATWTAIHQAVSQTPGVKFVEDELRIVPQRDASPAEATEPTPN